MFVVYMKNIIFISMILLLISCQSEDQIQESLADYLEFNASLELADLVACAGGSENGLLGSSSKPTEVFFYPIPGATDFRYFEAENVRDSADFSQYFAKELDHEPIFNDKTENQY